MRRGLGFLLGLVLAPGLVLAAVSRPPATAQPAQGLLVAAAADLRYAFEELAGVWRGRRAIPVTFSFGSSGQLAQQVEHGAPFDVFFSANEAFVRRLAEQGHILRDTVQLYAMGRIVLWVRRASDLDVDRGMHLLLDPRVRYVAIANPEHAPYGEAARQALVRSGLYDQVRPKLVYGENIGLTLQLVQSGNADVGVVALSLALAPPVSREGRFWLVPQGLHDPIRQAAGVAARSARRPQARAFLAFVNGPEGRPVMRRYGFMLPGEGP
ncbi:MAG: molybdate ABC transporter substrate-binding protein [Armatimonadota bacterium]|nr:molybdate ABC transporter substrate-binding protein [Armatimonadota bacterium]MDR7449842.1 molybdate ABC transporter substrate-binding protein [Armatimonadota bacterium]MDR7459122.1 molybdate ABC transporter substrate-binding protein [Armatimonadota bacterium]MDR7480396.1 molybdate ABC transporter substrate-binding protein [Armatimonadota bacterium]MDR7489406.1 molybdate ABC transporter substrate-binding protein [Armatimonadota bacterium]